MQRVFIYIDSEPGKMWDIADSALRVDGVEMAYAVTGLCDVIVYAELKVYREYSDLIASIQSIDGVLKTQTAMVIPRIERGIL